MTADLLPCPFCGGEAETVTGPIPRKWGVRCINCDVWRDDRCESEGDAITAWNTRAALPARWVPDYTLAPHLQKIVDGAKAVPQWDTQADRLAPTLSAALALPEVAALVEAAKEAREELLNAADEIAELKLTLSRPDGPWIGYSLAVLGISNALAALEGRSND